MTTADPYRLPVPRDLCAEHLRIWMKWRAFHYDPRNPRDWPGQHIMDSRTSHETRRAEWNRKTAEQMELTARICRTGTSPQCTREEQS